mmetsp:Transcript_132538/g.424165  ORF Transcript_132538/g.424165 Transcript_132538/m.424165 type:complete len:80 (-) Transcript_132538:173-412(-)
MTTSRVVASARMKIINKVVEACCSKPTLSNIENSHESSHWDIHRDDHSKAGHDQGNIAVSARKFVFEAPLQVGKTQKQI